MNLIRIRQIILLIIWLRGSPVANHLTRATWQLLVGLWVDGTKRWTWALSFLLLPTFLCGLGLLLGGREIFLQENMVN